MCSRKYKREVVFASVESALRTSLVAVIAVTLSLRFAKDWLANNSSPCFRALIVIRQTISLR